MRGCAVCGVMLAWISWTLVAVLPAAAAELPGLVVPDGLGVNIHFTDPRPGEMEMLREQVRRLAARLRSRAALRQKRGKQHTRGKQGGLIS